jgi:hypothetical protein
MDEDDLVFPCGLQLDIMDFDLCTRAISRREDQRIIEECLYMCGGDYE